MVEKESKENRSYIRADMHFTVKYRVMSQDEYEVEKETGVAVSFKEKNAKICQGVDGDITGSATGSDQYLVNFMLSIDEKLNRILALLSKDETKISEFTEGTGLDISGDGIKLVVDKPVEPGSVIHMNFVLSKLPSIFFDLFGRVVHAKPVNVGNKKFYHLGVNFIITDDCERDEIIAWVFQKQREDIRKTNTNKNID